MAGRRVPLGRDVSLARRSYLFLTSDAVEVDDVDGFDVYRSRVLLEDVSFLTLHKVAPWGLVVLTLIVLVLGATVLLMVRPEATSLVLLVFAVLLVVLALRLWLGVHYVSVVGLRSKARMAWRWRPRRAREVFNLLVERVGERQALGGPGATGPSLTEAPPGESAAVQPPAR